MLAYGGNLLEIVVPKIIDGILPKLATKYPLLGGIL